MFLSHRILPTALAALPGLCLAPLLYFSAHGEYYEPVYMTACAVFILASTAGGWLFSALSKSERSRCRAAASVFCAVILGWLAGALAFSLLNLTPLCVGQNNGDGNNSLGMCLAISLLSTLIFSPLSLLGAALSAGLAALPTPRQHGILPC